MKQRRKELKCNIGCEFCRQAKENNYVVCEKCKSRGAKKTSDTATGNSRAVRINHYKCIYCLHVTDVVHDYATDRILTDEEVDRAFEDM